MVEVTRVGNVIVLEYFSDEDKRIFNGQTRTKKEAKRHLQMVRDRDRAYDEIRKVYEAYKHPRKDPLRLEPDKHRNQNAMANPYLWI